MSHSLGRTLPAFIVAIVALVALSALGMSATAEPQGTVLLQNDSGTAEGYSASMADDYVVASALRANDNQYPLRVQKVQAQFYRNFSGANSSVYVRAVVYAVNANGYPQELVAASVPMTITTFYPQFVDLPLLQPVLLMEPQTFVAGIEYLGGVMGSTPSFLTDDTSNIAERKNFYSRNAGQTWSEHYAFWQTPSAVGYNMIRAWVETNAATPTGSPTVTPTPTPSPTATPTLEVVPEALWPGHIIGYSKQHTLARAPNGRLHLVYFDLGHRSLFYAWSDDNGAHWQPPIETRSPFYTFDEPGGGGSLVVDPDGSTLHLLIGQDLSTTAGTGGINGALYFRYHDGQWSAPERVANGGYAYNLAVGSDDRVHIVWSIRDIWYRVRSQSGSWGPERKLASGGWHPDIDVGPNGDIHIAYNDNDPCCASTWVEVRYLHSSDGGATWAAPERLTNDDRWSGSTAGAVDDRGRYHLTYLASGQTQGDVFYRRRETTGLWSEPEPLFQGVIISETGAGSPALESDAVGNLVVVLNCLDANHITHVCLQPRDAQRGWLDPRQLLGTRAEQSGLAQSRLNFACLDVIWNINQQVAYRCVTDVVIQPTPTPTPTPTATPGDYHARVMDERGTPQSGARVYRNGEFMGRTRSDGVLDLPPLAAGDELIALAPQPLSAASISGHTARSAHDRDLDGDATADPWAFQVFLTNLSQSPDLGPLHPGLIDDSAPGERRLVVYRDSPLIMFNLTVSIEWDADQTYLDDLQLALRRASAYLYDVTDGQMALGRITIFDRGEHWADADLRIAANNQIRPRAAVAGVDGARGDFDARFGPLWNGDSSRRGGDGDDCPAGVWSCATGYRTLVHEMGHYLLGLYDEYIRFPAGQGPQDAFCTHLEQAGNPPPEPNRASIMDYQYDTSELADKFRPELWSEACTRTEHWDRTGGESDWDTVLRRFHAANGAPSLDCRPGVPVPPNVSYCLWRPSGRGQVLPQPEPYTWPVKRVWPWPVIDRQASPDGPPLRTLYINWQGATDSNQSYQLRTVAVGQQDGRTVNIEQGLTVNNSIDLFGVAEGSALILHTLDRRVEATIAISTTGDINLTLVNPRPALAAHVRTAARMTLTPQTDGQGIRVEVTGSGQEEGWVEYALAGEEPDRSRLHREGDVQSAVLPIDLRFRATGKVAILTSDGQPSGPHLSAAFTARGLSALAPADVYSPDGRFWLHLRAGQVPNDTFVVVSVLGALADGLPQGWLPGGQVYAVRYTGVGPAPQGQIWVAPDHEREKASMVGGAALLGQSGSGAGWAQMQGVEMGEDGSLDGVWSEGQIVVAWPVQEKVFLPRLWRAER